MNNAMNTTVVNRFSPFSSFALLSLPALSLPALSSSRFTRTLAAVFVMALAASTTSVFAQTKASASANASATVAAQNTHNAPTKAQAAYPTLPASVAEALYASVAAAPVNAAHDPARGVVSLQAAEAAAANNKTLTVLAIDEPARLRPAQKTAVEYKGALNLPMPAHKE
jgi:hypothetical protein